MNMMTHFRESVEVNLMVENTFFDVFIDKKPLDLTSHFGAFQQHSQMDQNAGKKCKI